MARTSYITVPAGLEEQYYKTIQSGDRFTFSKIRRKDTLLTRRRIRGLRARSLLPALAVLWADFSTAQKDAWRTAAAYTGLNCWQLFVQDQIIRIKNDMGAPIVPSIYFQSWIGNIKISSPASEIKLIQPHPFTYWKSKKVYGIPGLREPVKITESFSLPLEIGLSYNADLTVAGANPYAKFYAKIISSYQGIDDEHLIEIDLDLQSAWKTVSETLSDLRGIIIGYSLFFHLHDLQGNLYFDNIKALHSGQNWARDPACKKIARVFTKVYFQVPQHWAAIILPTGAEYDSIYKDF